MILDVIAWRIPADDLGRPDIDYMYVAFVNSTGISHAWDSFDGDTVLLPWWNVNEP